MRQTESRETEYIGKELVKRDRWRILGRNKKSEKKENGEFWRKKESKGRKKRRI